MNYTNIYHSPLGDIVLAATDTALTGLWFDKQKYFGDGLGPQSKEKNLSVFEQTKEWLDVYFQGKDPGTLPPLEMKGSDFRLAVWDILTEIPYGKTITYKEISVKIAKQRGLTHMSAQAVGGAVGHNPISILVPCHRVIGSNGNLTGYAGGIDKKIALLQLEHVDMSRFFVSQTSLENFPVKQKKP